MYCEVLRDLGDEQPKVLKGKKREKRKKRIREIKENCGETLEVI